MSKNFELLKQTKSEEHLFQAPDMATMPVSTAGQIRVPSRNERPAQAVWKLRLPQIRWRELIEKVEGWRAQAVPRNGDRRIDLEAIVREEEFKLVQRIFLAAGQSAPRAVVFSGVEGGAGCASICARTGEILASQADEPVCVVDANLHSPSLHQYFHVDNFKGLAEALLESAPIRDFARRLPENNLWVLPSGLAAPQVKTPLASDRLQSRMTELRGEFRYIVIHSSPLGLDPESILLSRWTDGVVLVVEANSTRRETARRVKENLEASNVRVLGVVLNNRTFPIPDALFRRL